MFFVSCENRVKRELHVGILYYGTIIVIRHQNKWHMITVHNYKPKTMQKNSPIKKLSHLISKSEPTTSRCCCASTYPPNIRSLMQFNADLNERLKFLINPFWKISFDLVSVQFYVVIWLDGITWNGGRFR